MSEIRKPVTHNLKIWPEHYSAVCAGVKRAELRKNDRHYRTGDTLDLCEWDKDDGSFTGEFISVTVTHVADVGEWMPGYVLLSVELALRERAEPVYQLWSSGINQWVECDKGRYEAHAHVPAQRRVLYTAPTAPVVPDAIPETESKDGNDIDYMEPSAIYELGKTHGWNACRAAMLGAALGKEG
ncbi:DUF3850 domain-containing protein [Cronobacter malonaticus]|uniref:DUF3850 domain-containing protein n=1 Tax=Cronobacter malonaticus TaxID=413503 RepID=UPI002A24EDE9|nr:DUF3850 domain-containing protein [Cronobacter malonaticus]